LSAAIVSPTTDSTVLSGSRFRNVFRATASVLRSAQFGVMGGLDVEGRHAVARQE
jgi:hypothetical protein